MLHVKDIPSSEGRNAAMALYRRNADEVCRSVILARAPSSALTYATTCAQAEAILLQASPPLVYRAIKMNIRLFRWDRCVLEPGCMPRCSPHSCVTLCMMCSALDLALQHKTHVDTVLAYRQRSLRASKRHETNDRFKQFAGEVCMRVQRGCGRSCLMWLPAAMSIRWPLTGKPLKPKSHKRRSGSVARRSSSCWWTLLVRAA